MRSLCLVLFLGAAASALGAENEPVGKPTLALNIGGHTAPIEAVFFTANDTQLVSVADDKTIRVWDVATGNALKVLRLPVAADPEAREHILSAALAPGGRLIACASQVPGEKKDSVYVVDLKTEQVVKVLKGDRMIYALAWTPDGKGVVVGMINEIELWDVDTGKRTHHLAAPWRPVLCLAVSPDGSRLAAGGPAGGHRIWELPSGMLLKEMAPGKHAVKSLAWSKDSKTLASSEAPRSLRTFTADGVLKTEQTGKFAGLGLAFSPSDPNALLIGSCRLRPGQKKWNVQTRFREEAAEDDEDDEDEMGGKPRAHFVALARNGLAAWASRHEILIWNSASASKKPTVIEEPEQRFGGKGHEIHELAWSPNGSLLAWSYRKGITPPRSFDFGKLAIGGAADKTFIGEQRTRGELTLKHPPRGLEVTVAKGNTKVATLTLAKSNPQQKMTFLDDHRVLVAGLQDCSLFSIASQQLVRHFQSSERSWALAARPDAKYFALGGADQILRVYSPEQKAPVLSVFIAEREWIAWTPEGYYAASTNGERLMGWLVSNGPEQLATFHPAAAFRKSFFRPDMLQVVLVHGSATKALEAISKGAEKPIELDQVLPPKVRIVSPEPGLDLKDAGRVKVKAVAEGTGKHPVVSLQLNLDERPYQPFEGARGFRAAAKPAPGTKEEEWEVILGPGKHSLRVVAKNAVSSAMSASVEVTYTPDPKVTPAKGTQPALHVLAIGINDYPGDLELKCAVNDATQLAATLGKYSKALFPRGVFVKRLTDKDADRKGIRQALDDFKKGMEPQDVGVVFYAGHGHGEKVDGKFFLMPHGADIDDLPKTAVSDAEFKEKLAALPAGRVILMIDACHSGSTTKKQWWDPKAASVTDSVQRTFADEEVGVVVWIAAMGSEFAEERNGHGLFTDAMIQGLSGKAGRNKQGEINLASLDTYVFDWVMDESKGKQHPNCARPPSVYPFSLSKPAARP